MPGATIIPVIISTDKTQVTLFHNKSVYPVYLMIRNIPKQIRSKPSCRGYILLGYLPTTWLEHITNKAAQQRMVANLFHACMHHIMKPLEEAGVEGIEMSSGDGMVRQTHPILANYVGNYPEQTAVTSVKSGECPTCDITHNELGNIEASQLHDLEAILDALDTVDDDDPTTFTHACQDAGIKPIVHPFWWNLPYTNTPFSPNIH